MRISDWSSDVCSSDLLIPHALHVARRLDLAILFASGGWVSRDAATAASGEDFGEEGGEEEAIGVRGLLDARASALRFLIGDRKSVVKGKSVSVRVDCGGSRIS